jgi:class 3 adenylate cyclase
MADVFISYARSTAKSARTVAQALRALGYSVWFDEDLPAHRTYSQVIAEELEAAAAALVIWSADAAKSEWVLSEANRAREAHKLVQVLVDGARLPMPFDQIQYADLAAWSGEAEDPAWRKAVASIAKLVEGAAPESSAARPAPSRAAALSASPASEGERRHLAVLFCDMVSSTEIAARLDPEEWHAVASQYQRAASQAVAAFGGYVSKLLGDGVVAYFGYPLAQEDAAERAVRAGLAIVEAIGQLNARLAEEHSVTLRVRVGVHSGVVVVAPGDGDEPEFFGDAPNIASRVQDAAAPDTVVVTAAVHELTPTVFEVEDLGATPLKGAPRPVRLFRVVRPRPGSQRAHGPARGQGTPFVGRDDELQLLLGRWARVREGQGQFVVLTGEPGIGKSRLVAEFRARIGGEPHVTIQGAGAPFFANTPFHAVTQMIGEILGGRADESAQSRLARLEEALRTAGIKGGEAAQLIAEVLHVPVPPNYPPLMFGAEQRRTRLLAALIGWVVGASRQQPLLVVVDDLHWVDPSTLELVQMMAEQGATAQVMLLGAARPEFRAPWAARAHHTHVTLNRLDSRQTRALVAGVMSRAGLARDVIEVVIERTDGVPLFAEELTRLMLERNGHAASEIPTTLVDSLTARLDRLGRAKEVAQLGAVLGREFSYELLRAVWQKSERQLREDLEAVADAELIYARGAPPEATYRFKHALIQSAAYEALLKKRRRELHARVAGAIAGEFPTLAETQPEVVARHWTEAGEAVTAIAAWKGAGHAAFARRAFSEAEAAYRQALALLTTQAEAPERDARELELASALNRVLQLTAGYAAPETVEMAARARGLAEKAGSLMQLIREEAGLWRAVITAGDYAGAAALADHILDLAGGETPNPGRLLFALNAQVQTRFYTGDLAGVEAHFGRLDDLIATPGLRQAPGNNVIPIGVASLTAWTMGRSHVAHERMARALALAQESGDPYDLAMTLHFLGMLHGCERDASEAEAAARRLIALSEENGFTYAGDLGRSALGWVLGQRGAAEEGADLLRAASTAMAASGARVGMTLALTRLAETLALAGSGEEALAAVEEALSVNPQERVFRPDTLRLRAELRGAAGENDLAEADLKGAVELARQMGAPALELRAALALARLLQARGDAPAARALITPLTANPADLCAADVEEARALLGEL